MMSNPKKPLLFLGLSLLLLCCSRTYSKEQIDRLFEPITSQYGVEIVYEIGDTFLHIRPGGGGAHAGYCILEPIDKRVLVRYPKILEEALAKYPVHVIADYLNAVYFAGVIKHGALYYSGTYDSTRRIVYLVDHGRSPVQRNSATFHHEFSSLLLSRHGWLINPWLEQHPEGFRYKSQIYENSEDVYADICLDGTESDYEDGFMNSYGQTNFENDFNEYAAMVFAYPEKFKQIMDQYPRVRGKFLVFLDFFQKIDPIFTEAYFFGTQASDHNNRPASSADCVESPSSAGARLK
jgi:hypothetical protein